MWFIGIVITIFLILLGIAKIILNFIFGNRCDGNPNLKYFTVEDFDGLEAKKFEFKSNKKQVIRGNIYTNKDIKKYNGLLIFVHGMGGGHLSYTTEINTFARAGYIVMSYDNTGTCASEGKNLNGFYQSVIDLNNAMKFVKENVKLNKYKISLVGHSWGGYTVCQILKYKHNIKSVVSISGPNDSSKLVCDLLTNETKINFNFLKPFIKLVNLLTFGIKGIENTVDILKDTEIPVLLLHGEMDKTLPIKNSLVFNKEILSKKDNIETIIYKDKFHNVYQTKESEQYLNNIFEKIAELNKKYKGKELEKHIKPIYESIDYKKITEEDEDVMNIILEFLNK